MPEAVPPDRADAHPTVEDATAKQVLGHAELLPVLPGPGASDYERYLRTDELLSLQKTPEERTHHDELLFQCTHQASELWLKLAGEEMELATEHLRRGEIAAALRLLRRAAVCFRIVTQSL